MCEAYYSCSVPHWLHAGMAIGRCAQNTHNIHTKRVNYRTFIKPSVEPFRHGGDLLACVLYVEPFGHGGDLLASLDENLDFVHVGNL